LSNEVCFPGQPVGFQDRKKNTRTLRCGRHTVGIEEGCGDQSSFFEGAFFSTSFSMNIGGRFFVASISQRQHRPLTERQPVCSPHTAHAPLLGTFWAPPRRPLLRRRR
jgi:hypothetical protein